MHKTYKTREELLEATKWRERMIESEKAFKKEQQRFLQEQAKRKKKRR